MDLDWTAQGFMSLGVSSTNMTFEYSFNDILALRRGSYVFFNPLGWQLLPERFVYEILFRFLSCPRKDWSFDLVKMVTRLSEHEGIEKGFVSTSMFRSNSRDCKGNSFGNDSLSYPFGDKVGKRRKQRMEKQRLRGEWRNKRERKRADNEETIRSIFPTSQLGLDTSRLYLFTVCGSSSHYHRYVTNTFVFVRWHTATSHFLDSLWWKGRFLSFSFSLIFYFSFEPPRRIMYTTVLCLLLFHFSIVHRATADMRKVRLEWDSSSNTCIDFHFFFKLLLYFFSLHLHSTLSH